MKRIRVSFKTLLRFALGLFLVLHGTKNVFELSSFITRSIMLLPGSGDGNISSFHMAFLAVPFVEIVLGVFMLLGVYGSVVLFFSYFIFIGIAFLLLKAHEKGWAFVYTLFASVVFYIIARKEKY